MKYIFFILFLFLFFCFVITLIENNSIRIFLYRFEYLFNNNTKLIHVVASGDTLDSIVRGYPQIFSCPTCSTSPCTCPTETQVASKISEIAAWNGILNTAVLFVGARICLTGAGIETQSCIQQGICANQPTAVLTFTNYTSSMYTTFECQLDRIIARTTGCNISTGCRSFFKPIIDAMSGVDMTSIDSKAAFIVTSIVQTQGFTNFRSSNAAGSFGLSSVLQSRACQEMTNLSKNLTARYTQTNSPCQTTSSPCTCSPETLSLAIANRDFAFLTSTWFMDVGSVYQNSQCSNLLNESTIGIGTSGQNGNYGTGFYKISQCVAGQTDLQTINMNQRLSYYTTAQSILSSPCAFPSPSVTPSSSVGSSKAYTPSFSPSHTTSDSDSDLVRLIPAQVLVIIVALIIACGIGTIFCIGSLLGNQTQAQKQLKQLKIQQNYQKAKKVAPPVIEMGRSQILQQSQVRGSGVVQNGYNYN